MPYYHGSEISWSRGDILEAKNRQDAYIEAWSHTSFYPALEHHRPPEFLPHAEAVFMVGITDDIDLAGGSTEFCLEVQPLGPVSGHDLNWSSKVSMLIEDGASIDDEEVKRAAHAYWSGQPHPDESVWEFLSSSFVVLRCEPYETFDDTTTSEPWVAPLSKANPPRAKVRSGP